MASYYHNQNQYGVPFEVEVTISSAKDLKNVNWRHGPLNPYAVVWVTPNASNNKCSTNVDGHGDTSPVWDEKLTIQLTAPVEDSTLSIDLVHAAAATEENTKPLIGSARLPLRDVLHESSGTMGERVRRSLKLKRPSGRPHGTLDVKILLRESPYRPPPYYAPPPPYGVAAPPPPVASRDYVNYGASQPLPPPPVSYGGGYSHKEGYGQAAEYGGGKEEKKKSSKFGMGTGLAVGAVAGVLGGIALTEGVEHVKNKVEKDVAEKVEDDLRDDYDGGYGGYGDDDDY